MAQKVLKNAKTACSRLGQYRMPFAWAARYEKPLCVPLILICCVKELIYQNVEQNSRNTPPPVQSKQQKKRKTSDA